MHSVGDCGRSGGTKPGRAEPVDEDGVIGVGAASTDGADFEAGTDAAD